MSILRLDYQQHLQLRWAGLVLLALTLGGLALASVYFVELDIAAAEWEEQLAQAEQRRGRAAQSVRPGAQADLVQEVNRANEVLQRLTLPWNALFQAVETAAGKEVALLALEPDLEKQQVKISGEARDYSAVLNYVTQLEAQAVFGPVYLQSHQVQEQDPEKPVRFALLATWRGQP